MTSYILATVDAARLPLSLLDEVAEERGTQARNARMVNVTVQGLRTRREHEPRPWAAPSLTRHIRARSLSSYRRCLAP